MNEIDLETYRRIAARSYGEDLSRELYQYWTAINHELYGGVLPAPQITFEIMPYGKCIGLTTPDKGHIRLKKPAGMTAPKRINPRTLGVLLHENIHYAKPYIGEQVLRETELKPVKGADETSHNDLYWISEINRIHKHITGKELNAGFSKAKRVGKKVKRIDTGELTRKEVATYPHNTETEQAIYNFFQDTRQK